MAFDMAERDAFAFDHQDALGARQSGIGGLARLAHDRLLRQYLGQDFDSEASHEFDGLACAARRNPDRDKFAH